MPKLTRQQIIILFVMALAVIYGVYDLLIVPKAKSKIVSTDSNKPVEIGSFIADISANVSVDQLSQFDRTIIHKAEVRWQENPFWGRKSFREWVMIKDPNKAGSGAQRSFIYAGWLKDKNRNMAIINGVEYETGEELEEGGYILRKIHQSKVVIENIKNGSKFDVLLQE
jgi:hypothetical protein